MNIVIETNRLALRHIIEQDFKPLSQLFSDPLAMEFAGGIKTEEEIFKWLSLVTKSYQTMEFGPFAVIRKQSRQFIGYCGLYLQEDIDGFNEIEILYGLIRRFWGQGFASEAAQGVLEYGKNNYDIKRFVTLVEPQNERSIQVSNKLGMKKEKQIFRWNRVLNLYSLAC